MNSLRRQNPYTFDPALLSPDTEKVRDIKEWRNDPKPWSQYPHIHRGNQGSSAERHLLYRMARDLGAGNYADIGCLFGASTACMAHGLTDADAGGTIFTVDFFGQVANGEPNGHPEIPQFLSAYVRQINPRIRIHCVAGDSAEVGHQIVADFNFIWIDGDHSYYGCSRDIATWSPKVKVGGYLGFHDTHSSGVDQAIRELPRQWKFIRQVYSAKVFQRTK